MPDDSPLIDVDPSVAVAEAVAGGGDPTQLRHTFGAPRGTVRAILALSVAGSAYWLIANPALRMAHTAGGKLPEQLFSALLIVIGFYFADRAAQQKNAEKPTGPQPLWLPAGSVRALLVLGYLASVGWLVYQALVADPNADLMAQPGAAAILNIGMFLGGRLGRLILKNFHSTGKSRLAHVIDDIKGVVALLAGAAVVILFCFPQVPVPTEWRGWFDQAMPALISFYFGTK